MHDLRTRKNIRLKDYDYSRNGAYSITICVSDRHEMLCTVGEINNLPKIQLTDYGIVVDKAINNIPIYYPNITVDKYVIMPNHVHLILFINYCEKSEESGLLIIAPTTSISTVVQQLKRTVSKEIGFSLWQKSFNDHIIRDENDYQTKWHYIDENPAKWLEDEYYKTV